MDPDEEILDSPTPWVARHVRRYVETAGASGHRWSGQVTLLLTTRGRRSGRLRRTALIYGRDGDRYVVVASSGGKPSHPAWYLNLVAEPRVCVQVGAEIFDAVARPAGPEERPRLWRMMADSFPEYDRFQRRADKAGRQIPVVLLEPVRP
jgi:deazaflavin-dependent oxidoreductase (nitroreductase family)